MCAKLSNIQTHTYSVLFCSILKLPFLFAMFAAFIALALICSAHSISVVRWTAENIFRIKYPTETDQIITEANFDTTQLIRLNGYQAENHTVRTKDGYILTVHRIPHGKSKRPKQKTRIPVLLTSVPTCVSSIWVDNHNDSLGFILADEGYDVWLGNFRGNKYSRHLKYANDSWKFWNFSFDQYGIYDLRAMVDYILKKTRYQKIFVVGYSVGTLPAFELLASEKQYNDKIAGFIALAPVINTNYSTFLWRWIEPHLPLLGVPYVLTNEPNFLHIYPILLDVISDACQGLEPELCDLFLSSLGGYEPHDYMQSRHYTLAKHCSAGVSVKSAIHWAQMKKSQKLLKYDHGSVTNLIKYKRRKPPVYNISKISTPIAIFHAGNDVFASPLNIALISRQIPNLFALEMVANSMATHFQLLWLTPSRLLLYDHVLETMKEMWSWSTKKSSKKWFGK